MATEIKIVVGDSFADRHEQFQADLGDEYDEQMRQVVENELHALTQQLERQAEQQQTVNNLGLDIDESAQDR